MCPDGTRSEPGQDCAPIAIAPTPSPSTPPSKTGSSSGSSSPGDTWRHDSIRKIGHPLRDARSLRLKPKVRKLVLTEISAVERLYNATPPDDADRPVILKRLAENYVELAASATRDKIAADIKAQQLKVKNAEKAKRYLEQSRSAQKIVDTARKKAIARYEALLREYPQWCRHPSRPEGQRGCHDEVLYYLAYEHELAGNLDKARATYLRLTDGWQQSRFIPLTYLGLAEVLYAEALEAPEKWAEVKKLYEKVLTYPAPENRTWGFAALRLARVHIFLGEKDQARKRANDVVSFADQHPTLPSTKTVARKAKEILNELH